MCVLHIAFATQTAYEPVLGDSVVPHEVSQEVGTDWRAEAITVREDSDVEAGNIVRSEYRAG